MSIREPGTVRVRHGRRPLEALALPIAVAISAGLSIAVPADGRISSSGMHIPTLTNFCGQDSKVIEATICNQLDETLTYDITFFNGGTPPAYACTESIVPDHVFLDPVPVTVAPGQCKSVRIRMSRPPELDAHGNVCWWALFNAEDGPAIGLGAQFIDFLPICFDWFFAEAVVFLDPLDPLKLDPRITNNTAQVLVFDYLIQARGPDNAPDEAFISLNDQPPGTSVKGVVDVEPGASAVIPLTAAWVREDAGRYFDVVVMGEGPEVGRHESRLAFGDLASIGLHEAVAEVAVGEGTPAGIAPPLRVVPNPAGGGVGVSLELASILAEGASTASVHDAAGRLVRDLGAPAGGVLTWDGLDDGARRAGPGTYFVRVASPGGVEVARVVILP